MYENMSFLNMVKYICLYICMKTSLFLKRMFVDLNENISLKSTPFILPPEKQLKDNGSTTSDKPTEINSVKRDGRNSQYSRDLKIQKKNEQNSRIKVMKTVSIYLCEVGLVSKTNITNNK